MNNLSSIEVMPTGGDSDLISLRRATKRRLAELKQGTTYDQVVRALLDVAPPEAVQARLRAAQPTKRATAMPSGSWRDPEKQRLIASLAHEAWAAWRRSGKVKDLGPRAVAFYPGKPAPTRRLRVVPLGRRGFAP